MNNLLFHQFQTPRAEEFVPFGKGGFRYEHAHPLSNDGCAFHLKLLRLCSLD